MCDSLRLLHRLKHRACKSLLLVCILSTSFITADAIAQFQEVKLKVSWQAGPPTRHVVSYNLVVAGSIQDKNGKTKQLDNATRYEASYTQTITDYQEGLLVSFSDTEIPEPDDLVGELKATDMQQAILKLSSLAFGTRADYIVSTEGEFIRLHQFEKFVEDQRTRYQEITGGSEFFKNIITAMLNEKAQRDQIIRDLQLVKDWDQVVLALNSPMEKEITPAYFSKEKTDYKSDGEISYHGETDCNWDTQSVCVELRFSSNDKHAYDVQMVAERDSLVLHEYRASSIVDLEAVIDGRTMSNNSTIEFIRTVTQ